MLKYLITDPKYYSNNIEKFKETLEETLLKTDIDFACFRDKSSSNFEELAKVFVQTCKKHNIKNILINENIKLAQKLNVGIHLTSKQYEKIVETKNKNTYIIVSCHSSEDINKAQKLGANAVTYSPIFKTPNKGNPKGVDDLKIICEKFNIAIFALGGIISQEQVEQIAKTKAKGFASIRYFL